MEMQLQHIDPRVYELEKDIEFYQLILAILGLVLLLLLLIIYLQRMSIRRLKRGEEPKKLFKRKKSLKKAVAATAPTGKVNLKDLPDPGLIFKYSLGKEQVMEKQITVGQMNGNIKTFSTEIIDDHLTVYIRILENRRDKDI